MKEQQEVKRLYKVLTQDSNNGNDNNVLLTGPYQSKFKYEIGKEYHCENFNPDPIKDCSYGFYAVPLEGLLYCLNENKNNVVTEVEVWGREVIINQFKQRYENIKILRILSKQQVKQRIKKEWQGDYNLFNVLYPFHPLKDKDRKRVTKKDINNLKLWVSVWNSVKSPIGDSVWSYVGDYAGYYAGNHVWIFHHRFCNRFHAESIAGDSVWDSVWNSVGDSLYAYIYSLFPGRKKWKYIEHEEGTNPFQPAIDLWLSGLVPSFDGEIWRLHGGNEGKVLYKISKDELKKLDL